MKPISTGLSCISAQPELDVDAALLSLVKRGALGKNRLLSHCMLS
jgi:hypothetical protein